MAVITDHVIINFVAGFIIYKVKLIIKINIFV